MRSRAGHVCAGHDGDAVVRDVRDADAHVQRGLLVERVEHVRRRRPMHARPDGDAALRLLRNAVSPLRRLVRLGAVERLRGLSRLHARHRGHHRLQRVPTAHLRRGLSLADELLGLHVHGEQSLRRDVPRGLPPKRAAL